MDCILSLLLPALYVLSGGAFVLIPCLWHFWPGSVALVNRFYIQKVANSIMTPNLSHSRRYNDQKGQIRVINCTKVISSCRVKKNPLEAPKQNKTHQIYDTLFNDIHGLPRKTPYSKLESWIVTLGTQHR